MTAQCAGAIAILWPGSNISGELGEVIRRHGCPAVVVMPPDALAHGLVHPPDPAHWDQVLTAPEDANAVAGLLGGARGLVADEGSVTLADQVAEMLGVPGNDPATSWLRRDKGMMAEALKGAGLAHAVTIAAISPDEAVAAAGVTGYPAMVKPPRSCAGDGVVICRSPDELDAAWKASFGLPNLLGEVNDVLLVQEYLPGPAFTVNTVSAASPGGGTVHVVTDVWEDTHTGAGYDRSDLLSPGHPLFAALTTYTRGVLDALGVTWGPGHTEVRLGADGGPRAIDVAARLAGWYPQDLVSETLGLSQSEATVLAVTNPAALASRPPDYESPSQALTLLWMIVPRDGVILDSGVLAQTTRTKGVQGIVDAAPGPAGDRLAAAARPLARTDNLVTNPGAWNVAGPPGVVEEAVRQIRELERDLYRTPGAADPPGDTG